MMGKALTGDLSYMKTGLVVLAAPVMWQPDHGHIHSP